MNRRKFFSSLGAGVAAAMLPFLRPVKLVESVLEPTQSRMVMGFWYQSSIRERYISPEYKAFMEKILKDHNPEFFAKGENNQKIQPMIEGLGCERKTTNMYEWIMSGEKFKRVA